MGVHEATPQGVSVPNSCSAQTGAELVDCLMVELCGVEFFDPSGPGGYGDGYVDGITDATDCFQVSVPRAARGTFAHGGCLVGPWACGRAGVLAHAPAHPFVVMLTGVAMADDPHEAGEVSTWLAELAHAPPPGEEPDDRGLEVGEVVGDDRYVILAEIGRGGMGVVYEAEDRKLGRRVALKTHRCRSSSGRDQLRQEAQAMAKLSHPNVVAVHDVGEWDGGVFLVADLVREGSLESWQEAEHSWRDIVGIYIDAGRGLAFAHAAGLVHRDFKPANVLIGSDGRCQVTDFGIALLGGPTSDEAATVRVREGLISASTPVGTPAYMAPEQLLGLSADARSDQFSFCVALYEALFGQRPYPKTSLALTVDAKTLDPPTGRRVPRSLIAALHRGLSPQPSDRFPSMQALLERLQRLLSRGRRGVWAAAVLGTSALALAWMTNDEKAPCDVAPAPLEAWSNQGRARLSEVFAQDPQAARRWPAVERWVDDFAEQWRVTWRQVCLSRNDTTDALTNSAQRCLDDVGRDADATLTTLARASGVAARTGMDRVTAWTSPSECRHTAFLLAQPPPPLLALRPEAAQLRQTIREIQNGADPHSQPNAEQLRELELRLEEIRPAVERLGYPPLDSEFTFAESALLRSRDLDASQAALINAYSRARRAGHAGYAALASIGLAELMTSGLGRPEVGQAWAQVAVAEARQDGVPAAVSIRGELVLAVAWDMAGHWEKAAAQYDAALAASERLSGEARERHRAGILISVSGFEGARGNTERALSTGREAVETLERLDGRPTRHSLNALSNVGLALVDAGRLDEAHALFERELTERTALLGPQHSDLIGALINLGMVEDHMNEPEQARLHYEAADALVLRHFGERHPDRALIAMNLAYLEEADGRLQQALMLRERAVDVQISTLGERAEETLLGRIELANNRRMLGELEGPCRDLEELAELARDTLGETRVLVRAQARLSKCASAHDNTERAVTLLQDAIALSRRVSDSASFRHELQLELATIRWERGQLAEARRLAQAVLSQAAPEDPEHAGAQRWLTEHTH